MTFPTSQSKGGLYDSHVVVLESWDEFCASLDKKMVIMAPFCGEVPCEDLVKKTSARSDTMSTDNVVLSSH